MGEIIQLGGSGGTPSATNPNYYGGEIPFLGIADIEGRDIAHTAKTLTKEGLRNSAAWIVPAGAVSLAMYASVGKVGIIRQDTATSQAFYNMVFEDVAIRDFVFTRLEKADASFEWEPYISTGTQRNLNADKVKAFAIAVPGSREAAKIGRYFANLDSLITLHQRKHRKLVQLKKSMLDKMFPKPGETEPEIRFAGFTDPWEQRKLGELLLFQNGFNGSSESFGSGIPLISVMDVLDDEFITHETVRGKARLNCEEASRYCVEYGDVLFQRSSENQEDAGTSNVYLDQHVSSAFGGFVIRGKKVGEYNPIFIKYLLGSPFIREQITHRAQGAQHINVSQDTLADVVLLMPSMREQEAVGLVFLHLDNLITLHQRKLELLRNTKKSLLDRMFV